MFILYAAEWITIMNLKQIEEIIGKRPLVNYGSRAPLKLIARWEKKRADLLTKELEKALKSNRDYKFDNVRLENKAEKEKNAKIRFKKLAQKYAPGNLIWDINKID